MVLHVSYTHVSSSVDKIHIWEHWLERLDFWVFWANCEFNNCEFTNCESNNCESQFAPGSSFGHTYNGWSMLENNCELEWCMVTVRECLTRSCSLTCFQEQIATALCCILSMPMATVSHATHKGQHQRDLYHCLCTSLHGDYVSKPTWWMGASWYRKVAAWLEHQTLPDQVHLGELKCINWMYLIEWLWKLNNYRH